MRPDVPRSGISRQTFAIHCDYFFRGDLCGVVKSLLAPETVLHCGKMLNPPLNYDAIENGTQESSCSTLYGNSWCPYSNSDTTPAPISNWFLGAVNPSSRDLSKIGGTVFYFDDGVDTRHPEFLTPNNQSRVINGPDFLLIDVVTTNSSQPVRHPISIGTHGTTAAAFAIGNTLGFARNATLYNIPVYCNSRVQEDKRFYKDNTRPFLLLLDPFAYGVAWAADQVKSGAVARPAVLASSRNWGHNYIFDYAVGYEGNYTYYLYDFATDALQYALNNGLVFLTSAGNEGVLVDDITTYNSGCLNFYFMPFLKKIWVGGADYNYTHPACSTDDATTNYGNRIDIYGPATALPTAIASLDSPSGYGSVSFTQRSSGNSHATPMAVAVALAILQGLPTQPTNASVYDIVRSEMLRAGTTGVAEPIGFTDPSLVRSIKYLRMPNATIYSP